MDWSQRFTWADEMFDRISEAVNTRDEDRLYNLIADNHPNGLGDRASAREAVDALHSDDPLAIKMVIGLLQSGWDDPSQEWPTVEDIDPRA